MRLDDKSFNELLSVISVRRTSHTVPLFEVGINRWDDEAWPIVVNVLEQNRHFFLSRQLARELAAALISAADDVEVQCRMFDCAEVEDAKVHDRSSRKWTHDYDEQGI